MTDHRDLDDRIRRALSERAASVHPDPDAWNRIEEQRMSDKTTHNDDSVRPPDRIALRRWWIGGGTAVAAALLIAVAVVALDGDDDSDLTTADGTANSSTTVTTVAPSTTVLGAPSGVAYPFPGDDSFATPEEAAERFAVDVLGFEEIARVGAAIPEEAGGSGAPIEGTVTVTNAVDTMETTITVRAEDDGWVVLGATTPDIEVTTPFPGAQVGGSFSPAGRAVAFEGTVNVVVVGPGGADLGDGVVTGSGVPPAAPFTGTVDIDVDESTPAVMVFRTHSARDGIVLQATAVPVTAVPAADAPDWATTTVPIETPPTDDVPVTTTTGPPPVTECDPAPIGAVPDDQRVVEVIFHCAADGQTVAVQRLVPASRVDRLAATLEELLAGPEATDAEAGLESVFPAAGIELRRVVIAGGLAELDFSGVPDALPNASAVTTMFTQQVAETARQFDAVNGVEITFDGSCDAFGEWSQLGTCRL